VNFKAGVAAHRQNPRSESEILDLILLGIDLILEKEDEFMATVAELQTALDGLSSDIGGLATDLARVETDIQTLKNQPGGIQPAALDPILTQIGAVRTALHTVQEGVDAVDPATVVVPLALDTTALAAGTVGTAYSAQLAATGGTAPYTFAATSSSPDLSVDAAGAVTGTPTAAGDITLSVTVTDSATPTPATATGTQTVTVS